jgi:hypothetical protein
VTCNDSRVNGKLIAVTLYMCTTRQRLQAALKPLVPHFSRPISPPVLRVVSGLVRRRWSC